MRLGWYSRAVIVGWLAYTTLGGIPAGAEKQANYLAADSAFRMQCSINESEAYRTSALCADPVLLGDEPWMTLLNSVMKYAIDGFGYAILAVLAYWAARWIIAGARVNQPN